MMRYGFKPCGHCAPCAVGRASMCVFPIYDSVRSKTISDVSSTSLSQAYKPLDPIPSVSVTTKTKTSSKTAFESCYKSHPPFKLNDQITVYGGSASYPVQTDCDIYVSLDRYARPEGAMKYPWEDGPHPFILTYPVSDMSAPSNPAEFKKLVGWLKEQALAGKKIHVGCVGGHGRTGTLLAALVKEVLGIEDAITFVREHYCKKAVEASSQVNFLNQHFGITKVKGYKSFGGSSSHSAKMDWWHNDGVGTAVESPGQRHNRKFKNSGSDVAYPIKCAPHAKGNIWGVCV